MTIHSATSAVPREDTGCFGGISQIRQGFFKKKIRSSLYLLRCIYMIDSSPQRTLNSAIDKFEKGYSYPDDILNKDVVDLRFPDCTYDIVFFSHVLEHVIDDRVAMCEIYRVLKKDGKAIIQVPIDKNRDLTFEDNRIISPRKRRRSFGQCTM